MAKHFIYFHRGSESNSGVARNMFLGCVVEVAASTRVLRAMKNKRMDAIMRQATLR